MMLKSHLKAPGTPALHPLPCFQTLSGLTNVKLKILCAESQCVGAAALHEPIKKVELEYVIGCLND